jgi:hypothetical protein
MCFSHVNSTNLDYIFVAFSNVKKLKRKTLTNHPLKQNSLSLSISLSLSLFKVES